jgi:cell division protein FtsL
MIVSRHAAAVTPAPTRLLGIRIPARSSERTERPQQAEHSMLLQLMLAMCFVAGAAVLYLAQASQTSVMEYDIAGLQRQELQLNLKNADLHSVATNLQSFQRIGAIATDQLHMIKPAPSATIWIRPAVPWVPSSPLPEVSTNQATRRSQPLAWMRNFFSFVASSL